MPGQDPILRLNSIEVMYHEVILALKGVSLEVPAQGIVALLGANGAGKSTLLRSIAGFIKPSRGTVLLDGRDVTGRPPERNARDGLRLILDGHRVFPELSVADNIRLGAAIRRDRPDFDALAGEVLGMFPMLRGKLRAQARDLSGGQQQMLALAQAFVARPAVLLCDEPSLGLAQPLIPPILEFLRDWARQGVAVLIVEQQIDVALSVADRAIVIERGEVRITGAAADLKEDVRIRDIYLGLARDDGPPGRG